MTAPVVAVLDIGKTNLKLVAVGRDGRTVWQRSTPNRPLPGPPWLHVDLPATEAWLLGALAELGLACRPGKVEAFVAAAHGSGGVLVDAEGPVLPPVDYEEEPPAGILAAYADAAPPFGERGSPQLGGASHFGRQLFWAARAFPAAAARATRFLPFPQYWAWRLCGVPAVEPTMLGAQSHLWDVRRRRYTGLVGREGWDRLLPPPVPPHTFLGPPRPKVRIRTGLGGATAVLAGVHDSTANLYRYQAAGLGDAALLSTGTWIVGMDPRTPADALDEAFGMTVTSDVEGRPVAGVLAMTGREYAVLAGNDAGGRATGDALAATVASGALALPGFCAFDGVFPGSAGRGRVEGAAPADVAGRTALATLYAALVADVCLDLMRSRGRVVVDGGFVADPAFAGLVAALRPGQEVLVNADGAGTAAGAALLWTFGTLGLTPNLEIGTATPLPVPGLAGYRRRWREAVEGHIGRALPAAQGE